MIEILQVPPEKYGDIAQFARPLIQQALDNGSGEYHLRDIESMILRRELECLVITEDTEILGITLISEEQYQYGKDLNLFLIAGKQMKEKWFKPGLEYVFNLAKQRGLSHIRGYGIPRWRDFLARSGWDEFRIVFRKKVE